MTWIRKSFTAAGLTQVPAGPYLEVLQSRFGGVVMLMIDVSGSMHGRPILEAVSGAQTFIDEAVAAHYEVGVMLWNTSVVASTPPSRDGEAARELLRPVTSASGGNALHGPLEITHRLLAPYGGDRVVALFGDGDLTPRDAVLAKVAEMKSENIRFVTRGLGSSAAHEFASISDDAADDVEVSTVDDLAEGIAGMARSLRTSGLQAP